ncbi:hypothetical protein [Flavobacterium sp. UGB4466]|uniref:hypothetical protein n=1 Tax=Flavobacterium sp. UGB4466 TaxID=2730889 RepID=UPI00192A82D3|nr:hypothetical protein [Flavobacterium sp. UGB4466]
MRANKIKLRVKWVLRIPVADAVLKIRIKKGNVKLNAGFLNFKITKKITHYELIILLWRIVGFELKIRSLWQFLIHNY